MLNYLNNYNDIILIFRYYLALVIAPQHMQCSQRAPPTAPSEKRLRLLILMLFAPFCLFICFKVIYTIIIGDTLIEQPFRRMKFFIALSARSAIPAIFYVLLPTVSGPVRLYLWCATCQKSVTENVFFLMFRPRNKSSAFASGENEEEKWSKRRMEIYEPYLLLFRECFHIRYPHIKSSPPSLRFLIPHTKGRARNDKKEMAELTESRLNKISCSTCLASLMCLQSYRIKACSVYANGMKRTSPL